MADRDSIPGKDGEGIFLSSPSRQDRIWGPPSFLSSGYRGVFSGGKAAEARS